MTLLEREEITESIDQYPKSASIPFVPKFNPDPQLFVTHDLRVRLFESLHNNKPLQNVRRLYIKKASVLVPAHDHEVEVNKLFYQAYIEFHNRPPRLPLVQEDKQKLQHLVKAPDRKDFNCQRALEIMDLDLRVAQGYQKRGDGSLEELIRQERIRRQENKPPQKNS